MKTTVLIHVLYPVFTYVRIYLLIIFHFTKIHVVNHQSLPHGELTLSQSPQHPLVLSEPRNKVIQPLLIQVSLTEIEHFNTCFITTNWDASNRNTLSYPSSGVPAGEWHHLVKLFSSKLILRSSPAPSPSIRRRFRITSSTVWGQKYLKARRKPWMIPKAS